MDAHTYFTLSDKTSTASSVTLNGHTAGERDYYCPSEMTRAFESLRVDTSTLKSRIDSLRYDIRCETRRDFDNLYARVSIIEHKFDRILDRLAVIIESKLTVSEEDLLDILKVST